MDTPPPKKSGSLISRSKYELNLAEFPVTILSKRRPKGIKVIEYQDTITGKNGELVPRTWRVKPSVDYGFGSNQALATFFEIFQIWKEQGFETNTIRFGSLYNIVKRMGLENAQTAYERIRKDLNAAVEISIEAKNAFWDNEKRAYVDKTFHLFDEVAFYRKEGPKGQQPLPFAYIRASEVLWGSVQTNALLTAGFTRRWFYSLTPTAQRIALYLSKMLHTQTIHRRQVTKLAEQIPLQAQTYKKIKHQLTKGTQELLEKDYPLLRAFQYEKQRGGEGENIVFYRKNTKDRGELGSQVSEDPEEGDFEKARRDLLIEDIIAVTGAGDGKRSRGFYELVTQKLTEETIRRALSETKAASRAGEVRTTEGKFFTDTIKRLAAEQGIVLNPKKREGGGPSA